MLLALCSVPACSLAAYCSCCTACAAEAVTAVQRAPSPAAPTSRCTWTKSPTRCALRCSARRAGLLGADIVRLVSHCLLIADLVHCQL